jgi:hypothetical protein
MCRADIESTILIAHGTSQDQGSPDELTTRVRTAALAASREVFDIGGPGSVESAFKLTSQSQDSSLDIDLPTDVLAAYAAGAILGTGFRENVDEIVELILKLGKKGRKKVHCLGFSRGAVEICLAAEELGKIRERLPRVALPAITLSALDPVPGPFFIPKLVKVPKSVVPEMNLIYSKHEGRPGFDQLQIAYDGPSLNADIAIGIHGDVGGSTGSSLGCLILDRQLAALGLGGPDRLTLSNRRKLAMDCILNRQDYTDRPKFRVRTFPDQDGGDWSPCDRGDLELPMNGIILHLRGSPLPTVLLDPVTPKISEKTLPWFRSALSELKEEDSERFAEYLHLRTEKQHVLIKTPRPTRTVENMIIVPPPQRVILPLLQRETVRQILSTAAATGLSAIKKRKFNMGRK